MGQWFTFLILFNNFVPISLYVTLELVNFVQAAFIDEDILMYDEGQVRHAARMGVVMGVVVWVVAVLLVGMVAVSFLVLLWTFFVFEF